MPQRHNDNLRTLPPHWIGIRKNWQKMPGPVQRHLVSLPPSLLKTHALLIGATESGKTNLVHHFIAQDVKLSESFCVLDPRGDLVASTLTLCAGNVDPRRICLLDLREKLRPCGFNPLSGKGESYFRALNVLDVIASESDSWGVQIAETTRNVLMLLAESGQTLTRLEDAFYDRQFLHQCVAACRTHQVRSFWQRYDEMSPDKQSALAGPVLNKVSLLLATETLRRILGHSNPIDLGEKLNTRGSILLISLAVDEMHGAGRMLGRLVLSSICREIFARVNIPEARRNRVRLYVDEFEHFGLSEFETILAEGRKFGLSLVLAHQTLAQLSPKMRSVILNGVGVKVIFRTGREDGATLSKDLTGDPSRIDFTNIPTGTAALWRKGMSAIPIEINEPIVRSDSSRSDRVRHFIQAVRRQNREFIVSRPTLPFISVVDPRVETRSEPRPEPIAQPKSRTSELKAKPAQKVLKEDSAIKNVSHSDAVEDWLCG